ncbi:HEAT repeat domain-containing protein [Streptomyces sp. NPDC058412]|uniref:HEAT repeat domain-containing protein n=1 Tax=Streptomyces sp. NPDC058412 TaxID=3346486 RepID=UPI0036554FAA
MHGDCHLDDFVVQVNGHLSSGKPEAFFAAQGQLAVLADSGWAAQRVWRLLDGVCRHPDRDVPGMVDGSLFLGQGAGWSLTLRTAPAPSPPGILVSAAAHCLIAPLGPDPALVEVYARPAHERPDALDGRALTPLGTQTVAKGQVLALHAGQQLAAFTQPQTTRPYLLLTSPPVVAYRLAYDRGTLRPVQVISADLAATRLTYAIRFLAAAGRPTSGPRLEELSRHPQHQVRWEAIRALFRVDRAAGTGRLREAAVHDPHPEIRDTAAAALGQVPASAPRPVRDT